MNLTHQEIHTLQMLRSTEPAFQGAMHRFVCNQAREQIELERQQLDAAQAECVSLLARIGRANG